MRSDRYRANAFARYSYRMTQHKRPVFLADDEADDEFIIRRRLDKILPDHPVVSFRDGAELVDYLGANVAKGEQVAGLLLLDLKMPMMDGFDTLAWIRARVALAALTVVVVTSSERPEDRERALAQGAAAVMVKFPSEEQLAAFGRFA